MVIAENEICKLRELEKSDLPSLARLANNPKIAKNLRDGFPNPYSYNDAVGFYETIQSQEPLSTFVIDYKDEFAGMTGLMPLNDVYRKSAEIGYWLGEPFWNKGIATAAVKLLVEWGWKNLDIVRIHTGVFSYNPASARVLEKAEFIFECEFQKSIFKNEAFANELRYAILRV
jgi:[ribosomal protein S5]-alanine N-acetyltransferase